MTSRMKATDLRTRLRHVASACLVAFGALPGAYAMDLLQAYDAARAHDPTLAAAEAAYRASGETVPQARAGLGPSVQGSGSANHVYSRATDASSETGSTVSASIGATQPIYRPAALYALDQAKSRQPGMEATLAKAQQDLILRVAQAYLSMLQAIDTLEVTKTQKNAVGAQFKQASLSYQIGYGNVMDAMDAKARYDLVVATELQARGGFEIARKSLERLTGQRVTALTRIAPQDTEAQAGSGEDFWQDVASRSAPDVLTARSNLEAQRFDIDIARAAFLPTLDFGVSATKTRSSQTNLNLNRTDGTSAAVGFTLTVPIWEPGLRNSKLRQAQAMVDQTEQLLSAARESTELAVQQALASLYVNAAQTKALEQAVKSSQVSLDGSLKGREVGSRNALDELNARQQLYQAQMQLSGSRYAAVLSLLQLKAAAGTLGESDLRSMMPPTATPVDDVQLPASQPLRPLSTPKATPTDEVPSASSGTLRPLKAAGAE